MKYLIFTLCFLLTFTFSACGKTSINMVVPPVENLTPLPPQTEDSEDTNGNEDIPTEEPEEERKKKSYIVSQVNGLRIRKGANGASAVIGTLDKNDALSLTGEKDEYYTTVYKETVAYVHKDYCTIMETEAVNDKIEKAIELGSTLLGYPYVWGSERYHWGNGKLNKNFVNGEFDCSALVQYVFYISNGIVLDVNTRTQVYNGVEVKKSELSRGDLMFFTNESRKNKTGVERIGHVGIYFGNNYILHTASDYAVIEPISATRWSYYITARRVV